MRTYFQGETKESTNSVYQLYFLTTLFTELNQLVLGKEFRPGAIICLQSPSNTDFPIFGEITRIFVPNDTKKLLVQLYDTENYSPHYNGYQVAKIDQFS